MVSPVNILPGRTAHDTVRRCSDVAGRTLDGTFTLLSATGRQVHFLNDSAAAVWDAIGDGKTFDRLVDEVAGRFDVDRATVHADVQKVLPRFGALVARGELENTPGNLGVPLRDGGADSWAIDSIGPLRTMESTLVVEGPPEISNEPAVRALFDDLKAVLEPLARCVDLRMDEPRSIVTLRVDRDGGSDGPLPRWIVSRNGDRVASAASIARVREVVLAEVNSASIDALRHSVGWHAGAIEFPDGVVVFPGRSNAGKSTLVTQLMQRGHGYLTDEALAVDVENGKVTPFPKSVCVDPGAKALFPELATPRQQDWSTWHVDPSRIGPGRLGTAGRPVAFVFPEYRRETSVSFERLSRHEALDALLENSFDFGPVGAAGASVLLAIADQVPCYALIHGGQPEHLAVLEERFGAASA